MNHQKEEAKAGTDDATRKQETVAASTARSLQQELRCRFQQPSPLWMHSNWIGGNGTRLDSCSYCTEAKDAGGDKLEAEKKIKIRTN